jgi:hypothetical protein
MGVSSAGLDMVYGTFSALKFLSTIVAVRGAEHVEQQSCSPTSRQKKIFFLSSGFVGLVVERDVWMIWRVE